MFPCPCEWDCVPVRSLWISPGTLICSRELVKRRQADRESPMLRLWDQEIAGRKRVLTLVFPLFLNHWTYASAAFERSIPVVMLTAAFDVATCRFRGWKTPGNDPSGNSPWRGELVLRVEWVLHAKFKVVKTTVDFFFPNDIEKMSIFIYSFHILYRVHMSWLDLQCGREAKAAQGDEAEPRQMTPEVVAVRRSCASKVGCRWS